MRTLATALGIVLWLASTAVPATAGGRFGHGRDGFHGSRHTGRHHHHGHHGALRAPFFFPLVAGPSVVVTSPLVVAPAPVYVAPPVAYGPQAPYAYGGSAAYAAPPPMPRVVEFPTGRYELRGDGVYTPYAWVWVPNPPVAPPPPPPPTAPPSPPASGSGPPGTRTATVTAVLYRWTDEQGVTTWTDSLEKVPRRYREQTGRLTP